MWTGYKNHINILYEASMEGSRNKEPLGKVQENTEVVDKAKLDLMTKEMLEEFLRWKGRNEAVDLLHKYSQNAEKVLDAQTFRELSKRRNGLVMWSTFGWPLFGGVPNWEWKPLTKNDQTTLLEIVGIRGVNVDFSRTKNLQGIKEMQDFVNKNRIDEYASKWVQLCLTHPQQIRSGLTWGLARITAWKNAIKPIEQELNDLKALGTQLPKEYIAVIETLINITNTKEFWKYTWNVDVAIANKHNVMKFQENFRTFIELSAKQKRTFTKEDFDKFFDEKRKLNPLEQETVRTHIAAASQDINNLEWKEVKLKRLEEYIKSAEKNPNNLSSAVIKTITDILKSHKIKISHWNDGWITDFATDWVKSVRWQWNTDENREIAQRKADDLITKSGEFYFIKFDTQRNDYIPVSIEELRGAMTKNVQTINIAVFNAFLEAFKGTSGWEKILVDSFWSDAIASIGAYANMKDDTRLFKDQSPEVKQFFIETYKRTVVTQKSLLEKSWDKLTWDFVTLFPNLSKNPRITPEIQELLKQKNLSAVYDKLTATNITNGEIREIMGLIERDWKTLAERATKATKDLSEKLGKKTLYDIRDGLNLSKEEDAIRFGKIKDKSAAWWGLSVHDETFLEGIAKPWTEMYLLLHSKKQARFWANIQFQSNDLKRILWKTKENEKAIILTPESKERIKQAWIIGETKKDTELTNIQSVLNTDGMKKMSDIERIQKLEELAKKDPRTLSNTEGKLFEALIVWKSKYVQEAHAVSQYVRTAGKNEAIALIRETSWYSRDEEAEKYINKQVFLSKYVEEKNFVDMVEKNAAYMNLGETKSIGELHGMSKVDISSMSSDSESIKLGETSIMWHNSFAGMNTLMNCRVEVGESWVFSRTIRTPEWQIIAENIPLENISTTIQQLARFYTIWLWPLVPKMKEVNNYISKVRPDAIWWTDGTYGIKEDEKFLRIMAIMLYGEEKLPWEKNIPNLIRVFNQPGRENEPSFALKQKWILTETGWVNETVLEEQLKMASTKI